LHSQRKRQITDGKFDHAAQLLRREVRADGIKVTTINPGVVKRTYMAAQTYEAAKRAVAQLQGSTPEEVSSRCFDVGKNDKLNNPVPTGQQISR
jgi:NADP-dependent 3-hydroxy acid dehydrogenase YdfG